jgi:hypothetical protein
MPLKVVSLQDPEAQSAELDELRRLAQFFSVLNDWQCIQYDQVPEYSPAGVEMWSNGMATIYPPRGQPLPPDFLLRNILQIALYAARKQGAPGEAKLVKDLAFLLGPVLH